MSALYFLLLLFLPTQFGKHFWPNFSFVDGIRIDYLSPTLYFTDCLIILLFFVCVRNGFLRQMLVAVSKKAWIFYFLFIASMSTGIMLSVNPFVGVYGLLKFFEFSFVGIFTKHYFQTEKQWRLFFIALSMGICGESLLTIWQFFNGGSIGGIFYFFGERFYSATTPNIANAAIGQEIVLRPYGTFSHPNVLAGYLLLSIVAIYFLRNKIKLNNILYFPIFLGSFALLLTLSRVAAFLLLIVFAYSLLQKVKETRKEKKLWLFFIIFIIPPFFIGAPIVARFLQTRLNENSLTIRIALLRDAFLMIKDHLIFGVGLDNFLNLLSNYPLIKHTVFYLQPVHNIYMLIIAEVGFAGGIFVGLFIWKTIVYAKRHNRDGFLLLILIGILGFFDHYFLTLQQGQLLLAVVLGTSWRKKA